MALQRRVHQMMDEFDADNRDEIKEETMNEQNNHLPTAKVYLYLLHVVCLVFI